MFSERCSQGAPGGHALPSRSRSLTRLLLAGALLLAAATGGRAADAVFNVTLNPATQEVQVNYKSRTLLGYIAKSNPFKPYVSELYSLDGISVLRDAPADHLHHHGLMYAIKVNDTNFWEETPGCGYQRGGTEISRRILKSASTAPAAEFGHDVYWVPAKDAPNPATAAYLIERRTILVTVDESAGELGVEWRSDFEVGPAVPKVTLTGAVYHGLGFRFPAVFDHTARRQNAAGAAYTAAAQQDITPAAWASMAQTVEGRDVTVTMFDDPANAAEPRFFSMLNAFAYLSATQGLDEKPIAYAAGQKFTLRYLVTVHCGNRSREQLQQRYEKWVKR